MCLKGLGVTACAPNSETQWLSENMLNDLKERFTYIVTFYDNDRPGMFNMAKIRRNHPELLYFFIPHKFKVKDISDFIKIWSAEYFKIYKVLYKKLSNYVKK